MYTAALGSFAERSLVYDTNINIGGQPTNLVEDSNIHHLDTAGSILQLERLHRSTAVVEAATNMRHAGRLL